MKLELQIFSGIFSGFHFVFKIGANDQYTEAEILEPGVVDTV